MRKWLILLFALAGTGARAAPAWTWIDANGTVHFSDRPVPGARQVELTSAQSFNSQQPVRAARAEAQAGAAPTAPYRGIEIASPAEQETLWNIGAVLTVQVSFDPPLRPGHYYDLIYDGQRRNLTATSPRVTLLDVFRGQHTLQAVVLDSNGRELMRSPARTFYVQQTSALNPNSRTNPAN
jgi:hypothetical protein